MIESVGSYTFAEENALPNAIAATDLAVYVSLPELGQIAQLKRHTDKAPTPLSTPRVSSGGEWPMELEIAPAYGGGESHLYCLNRDTKTIVRFSMTPGLVEGPTTAVGNEPTLLLVSPDGKSLYCFCGGLQEEGTIQVFARASSGALSLVQTVAQPAKAGESSAEAQAAAIDPSGETMYVSVNSRQPPKMNFTEYGTWRLKRNTTTGFLTLSDSEHIIHLYPFSLIAGTRLYVGTGASLQTREVGGAWTQLGSSSVAAYSSALRGGYLYVGGAVLTEYTLDGEGIAHKTKEAGVAEQIAVTPDGGMVFGTQALEGPGESLVTAFSTIPVEAESEGGGAPDASGIASQLGAMQLGAFALGGASEAVGLLRPGVLAVTASSRLGATVATAVISTTVGTRVSTAGVALIDRKSTVTPRSMATVSTRATATGVRTYGS